MHLGLKEKKGVEGTAESREIEGENRRKLREAIGGESFKERRHFIPVSQVRPSG